MAIVSQPNIKVNKSDTFESANFRIESSPEAFRILSDGLYSNKVKAVIRELSTNAVDSLIDAGTQHLGYETHLPTSMEPHFSIRDFGTGLGHQEVVGLYTTYFSSNKTHSNEFTGQLGLGSKSPFAYTDSFTITSCKDGYKRVYNAHISEAGYPAISLLTEDVTDEYNGIEIKFPVKSEDNMEFEEEAVEVYRHFNLRPSFVGKQITIESEEPVLKGNGWRIETSRYRADSAIAIMGNIAYPISKLDSDNSAHTNLIDTGVVIDFNIGDLSITPSRESLSMTKRTIHNLKKRLDEIISEIKDEVQGKFDGCETLWDARCVSASLFGSWSSPLYHLGNVCRASDIQYKGDSIQINTSVSLSDLSGVSMWNFNSSSYSWRSSSHPVRRESTNGLPCSKDIKIFVDDLSGTGAYSRCKEWTENNSECYLVRFTKDGVKNHADIRKEFLDFTGMDESVLSLVSELPKPTRFSSRRGTGTGVRKDKVLLLDKSSDFSNNSQYWDSCEVDFDNGGLYVEINRYKTVDSGVPEHPEMLRKSILCFDRLTDEDTKVYGVKSANIDRYRQDENWISLSDHIQSVIQEEYSEEHKSVLRSKENDKQLTRAEIPERGIIELGKVLSNRGEVGEFCKVVSDMRKSADREDVEDIKKLLSYFDDIAKVEVKAIATDEILEKKYGELLEKYELLKVTFASGGESYWCRRACDSFNEEHWKIIAKIVEEQQV